MSAGDWRGFALTPDDVLFFRDGRPSTRGSDHYLRSLFPPHPSTLYGALRTRRLLDAQVELDGLEADAWAARLGPLTEELGKWGCVGSLELRGPWLAYRGERLLPAPADLGLLLRKDNDKTETIEAVLRYRLDESASGATWSHPLGLMVPHERPGGRWLPWRVGQDGREPTSAADYYLRPRGVAAWLRGDLPAPGDFVPSCELWLDEMRTGVGLQAHARSSAEGQIYTFGYVRLRPGVALGFEARGTALTADGRVRLGSDGRTARLDAVPDIALDAASLDAAGRACLYFATPTLARAGAYPPGFDVDGHGHVGGHGFRVAGAIVEHPVPTGGWNVAQRTAKPLRRGIPAGSVFVLDPDADAKERGPALAALAKLHGAGLADFPDECLARQGFGLALVGAY